MKTVVIEVGTLSDSLAAFARAWENGTPEREARIRFASFDLLWKTLTPNRMRLLRALMGAGPTGVRELARRVGRDVRAVHADCARLAANGVINKMEDGKLLFPYEALHVNFDMQEAA